MKEKKNRIKKDLFNGIVCKEGNRQTAGITLITLVITIVVLIILAGVVISLSLGENGLFKKAKMGAEEYKNAQVYEETQISKFTNDIDSQVNGNRDNITISEEELEILINEKIIEKLTTTSLLDYENKVNISSYRSENNKYTFLTNGIIQISGTSSSGGWCYVYINGTHIACLQNKGHHDAYSTIVNKGDNIYFESHTSSWTMETAYFIPFK